LSKLHFCRDLSKPHFCLGFQFGMHLISASAFVLSRIYLLEEYRTGSSDLCGHWMLCSFRNPGVSLCTCAARGEASQELDFVPLDLGQGPLVNRFYPLVLGKGLPRNPMCSQRGLSRNPMCSQRGLSRNPMCSQRGLSRNPMCSQRGLSRDPLRSHDPK
jgi:hypothetical protein